MKIDLHFNKPQLRSLAIDAPNEVAIMGRGTGKTVGILARKSAHRYLKTMPRGTGVLLCSTFTQAYERTLKELIRGWQMLGYQDGFHFIVGTKPTDKWKKMWGCQSPYAPPKDFKHFITWHNGAIIQIISQERRGGANGVSIDWIIGDEAKLLNEERYKSELSPANRGVIKAFENNHYHHGVTFTTDMPTGTSGRWLMNKVKDMNVESVNEIWKMQDVKFELMNQYFPFADKSGKKEILKQCEVIEAEMNDFRKGLLYYHEGSSIDNIHALGGVDYIKTQIRESQSEFLFNTQILNIKPLRMEDGFYPNFDEQYHGYFAENESYFDNAHLDPFGSALDCRKDSDVDTNAPLHIALDYNRRIHPIVVGQDNGKEIKSVKGLDAQYPGKLKEALKSFIDYYRYHKRKYVYYWYDHTAVGGENETAKCDDVIDILTAAGWIVEPMYIGKAPGHETKYRMWADLLQEDGKYNRVFRINRENCAKPILSMTMAEAEQRKDGFGKDKKSEHDPNVPADESTHYSDAMDMMVFGMLESGLSYGIESKSAGGSIIFS